MKTLAAVLCILLAGASARAQERRDQAVFAPRQDATLDAIKAEARKKTEPPAARMMWIDFAGVDAPRAVSEFKSLWHLPPLRQGISGMCWSYATTSLLESEVHRLSGRSFKLSELHTVYWEYVEKARGFVKSRGQSVFGEGSQPEALLRALRTYGAVPAAAYTGLKAGQQNHDHESTVFAELKSYLGGVKAAGAWNEELVVSTVRSILDHHLGPPPARIEVEGKKLTPRQYLEQVLRLVPDDYVAFLSWMDKPHWQKAEYEVPDNWWHGKDYVNLPLDVFLTALKNALRGGYSVAVAADISEPGYSHGPPGIAVVPSWDIPSAFIDEAARQYRFANRTTTDDHVMHLVGFAERAGKGWYLAKDSWSSAWNNDHPGYYFMHEDYVKLKVLAFLVHRDAVKSLLAKVAP